MDRVVGIEGFLDEIAYDTRGLPVELKRANGASTKMTYDAKMQLVSLLHADTTGKALEAFGYSYDRVGNLMEIADQSSRMDVLPADVTFGYDALYRMLTMEMGSESAQSEQLTYAYDDLDNITSITSSLEAASPAHVGAMSYDAAQPNAIASAGDVTFAHDAAGFMTARGEQTIDWDHRGRIAGVQAGEAPDLYMYAADQQLIGRVSADGVVLYAEDDFELRDGVSHSYVRFSEQRVGRQASTALMASLYPDLDEDAQITAADAYAAAQDPERAASEAGLALAATPRRVLGAAAARMLAEEEDARAFLHTEHLGSLTIATDEGGEVRGQRSFYATGLERWSEGYVDAYGFTGQEHLESGLIRFQFRHLDPKTGRWLNFDPAFEALDASSMARMGEATTGYAYVSGKFPNRIDPLGLTQTNTNAKPKGGGGGGVITEKRGGVAPKGSLAGNPNAGNQKKTNVDPPTSQQMKNNPLLNPTYGQSKGSTGSVMGSNSTVNAPINTTRYEMKKAMPFVPEGRSRNGSQSDVPRSSSGPTTTAPRRSFFQRAGDKGRRVKRHLVKNKRKYYVVGIMGLLGVMGVAVMMNPFDG